MRASRTRRSGNSWRLPTQGLSDTFRALHPQADGSGDLQRLRGRNVGGEDRRRPRLGVAGRSWPRKSFVMPHEVDTLRIISPSPPRSSVDERRANRPLAADGPYRARRHRDLLYVGRGHQRRAVHDPAQRAGDRPVRASRLPVRGNSRGAGGLRLRDSGFGDASCRRQLRLRQPGVEPVSRLRRQLFAVVRPVDRHRRGLLRSDSLSARYRRCHRMGGSRLPSRHRTRPRRAGAGIPLDVRRRELAPA